MNSLLLTGGRVIDPANRLDTTADLLILDGKIAAVGPDAAKQAPRDVEKFDAVTLCNPCLVLILTECRLRRSEFVDLME